jgi:hypothetical protein
VCVASCSSGDNERPEIGERTTATNQQEHVLSGYKALDFTQHIAEPTATRLLVETGAEVIKVELAPDGEPSRRSPYMKGHGGTFIQQNQRSFADSALLYQPKLWQRNLRRDVVKSDFHRQATS